MGTTNAMRVLIVDDEQQARTALTNALSKRSDVETLDTASDAVEALDMLDKDSYDVLLLDVNMPELTGTALVDRIKNTARSLPAIVFVTACQQQAIAAFAGLVNILPHLQRAWQRPPCRIAIKVKGRILFIDPGDVVAVQAEGNYVLLQRETGSYLLRESISAIAEKLKPYGFIRIHRSVLVNAAFVEELQPRFTGEYGLRVKGGKEYTVTRTYKKNLKLLAELWIAPDSDPEQT
jgi:DNA-binding LytR/AlgR family response regulator